MQQQPVKVAVIFGILVIAIIAALTFKRDKAASRSTASSPITVNKPVIDSTHAFEERFSRLTGDIRNAATPPSTEAPTNVDLDTPPPALPAAFTREPSPEFAPTAPFSFASDAEQSDVGPRKHRVRDGDTLANLAERFLGDAARAPELLEANREVIKNADLLPIGAELTIPAAKTTSHEDSDELDLVPVAPAKVKGR